MAIHPLFTVALLLATTTAFPTGLRFRCGGGAEGVLPSRTVAPAGDDDSGIAGDDDSAPMGGDDDTVSTKDDDDSAIVPGDDDSAADDDDTSPAGDDDTTPVGDDDSTSIEPVDADGDGFNAALDCDDGNADVHPGQLAFFALPRTGWTYDYDCDGVETPRWTEVSTGFVACSDGCAQDYLTLAYGWLDMDEVGNYIPAAAIPPCGAEALQAADGTPPGWLCLPLPCPWAIPTSLQQECR